MKGLGLWVVDRTVGRLKARWEERTLRRKREEKAPPPGVDEGPGPNRRMRRAQQRSMAHELRRQGIRVPRRRRQIVRPTWAQDPETGQLVERFRTRQESRALGIGRPGPAARRKKSG